MQHSGSRQLRRVSVALTLALATLVAYLCLSPTVDQPDLVALSDKAAHLLAYAALIAPTAFLSPRDLPRVAVALTAFGAGIEIIQPLVGRTQDVMDFGMNVLGLVAGSSLGVTGRSMLRI